MHQFFQRCDHEMLGVIHLHPKAPIVIEKKTKDVRVYCEASDTHFDEPGNQKHKYGHVQMRLSLGNRTKMVSSIEERAERIAEVVGF